MTFLLNRYLARIFAARFVALLLGLSVLVMFLDLLANADKVLETGGETMFSLLRYAGLRLPEIMSDTVTFAVLLAALLTLGVLVRHHELVALRSVGISQLKLFSMLPSSYSTTRWSRAVFTSFGPGGLAIMAIRPTITARTSR